MRKTIFAVMAVMIALSGTAWAADVQGTVKSVDTAEKSFVFEDGTKIFISDGVSMDKIKEGADVKASYDEKDGKKMATSLEVKD